MKIGDVVNFYRPTEKSRKDAKVVGIDEGGAGKLLALEYTEDGETQTADAVAYYPDAPEGAPFWMLKGVERAPTGWADAVPTEVTDEEAAPKKAKRAK